MPRDPALAMRAEKAFLDGQRGEPGVKAALDARLTGEELTASYQRALDALEECAALVKVGLSPTAAVIGAIFIVAREGLEAVIILAALLAGLRGAENAGIRRRIGAGAWLALGATAVIFVASRTLLQGLSHYGETLEAVISVVAVIVLLIVTNWVFHKYYWTGWNARLRTLSKAAQRQQQTRWEGLALIGVGFVTIFREGFETTLFMQSLILEAGMRPVLLGLAIGGLFIGVVGLAVFSIGAKLPYRKMLVITGVLVIFVLIYVHGIHGQTLPDCRLASCSSGSRFGIADVDGGLVGIVSDVGRIVDSLWNLRLRRRDVAIRESDCEARAGARDLPRTLNSFGGISVAAMPRRQALRASVAAGPHRRPSYETGEFSCCDRRSGVGGSFSRSGRSSLFDGWRRHRCHCHH